MTGQYVGGFKLWRDSRVGTRVDGRSMSTLSNVVDIPIAASATLSKAVRNVLPEQ